MSKQIKEFKVDYPLDIVSENEIDYLILNLQRLKELGATHVHISAEVVWDTPYMELYAYYEREETDEEYQKRLIREAEAKGAIEAREREKMLKLMKKYGIVVWPKKDEEE